MNRFPTWAVTAALLIALLIMAALMFTRSAAPNPAAVACQNQFYCLQSIERLLRAQTCLEANRQRTEYYTGPFDWARYYANRMWTAMECESPPEEIGGEA